MPPSRSSSLHYRANHSLANTAAYCKQISSHKASKFYKLSNNNEEVYNNYMENSNGYAPATHNTLNKTNSFDRGSIYSTYSLRISNTNANLARLSSFNLSGASNGNNVEPSNLSEQNGLLLNKSELFKIETCYKSMCSIVTTSKCLAELHTTNLDNLVRLLDWKHQMSGVPVWVFNTGMNPKRPKSLSLVMADKKTGFALWKLNNLTYLNDLKWTKPGHLTFKIFANNLCDPQLLGLTSLGPPDSSNTNSLGVGVKLKSKFSIKKSNSLSYKQQPFSIRPSNTMSRISESGSSSEFVFGALKFDSEFECSKFYDYYRSLFVDVKNDDLFNPNFNWNAKQTSGSKSSKEKSSANIVKILYRKITKNSISSPCAFHHINGLSILNKEAMLAAVALKNGPPATTYSSLNINTNQSEVAGLNGSIDSQGIMMTARSSDFSSANTTANDSINSKSLS
jgi:hypothetical protein